MQKPPIIGEPALIRIRKHKTIHVTLTIHTHKGAEPMERAEYIEFFANLAKRMVSDFNEQHFEQQKDKLQLLSGLAGVPPYNVDINYEAKAILKELGYSID